MFKVFLNINLYISSVFLLYSQRDKDTILNRRHVHIYYKYDEEYFERNDSSNYFEFKTGLPTGKYHAYWPKLFKDTVLYVEIINGLKDGLYKRFDKKGRLVELSNYVDDNLNGIRIIFLYKKKSVYENRYRYINGEISEEIKIEF